MEKYDFSGWVTRNDLQCSDGRIIRHNAFRDNDGKTVPLVWNHRHNEPENVLGHIVLQNRDEGVYGYGTFNETENGQLAKVLVQHGDIDGLSIYANRLKQIVSDVVHGNICEVSLVHATANPGAFIDNVIAHSDEEGDGIIIYADEGKPALYHADGGNEEEMTTEKTKPEENNETIGDVFNTLNEKQKEVVYAMVGLALEEGGGENENGDDDEEEFKGGTETMKHNVFDQDEYQSGNFLSHSDQVDIVSLAKTNSVGSLQDAISIYLEQNDTLAHGFEEIETLFPEYKDVRPGAPELIQRDQGWVDSVIRKIHKSPISRIRTRQTDVRGDDLRALGYKKGNKKSNMPNVKLLKRTTDPQTVYIKDALNRDDIVDITDFDVVEYEYGIMRQLLNEEIAIAAMIGDGREDGDTDKIDETHIRPIWKDDELYTIHADVDIEAARSELQGTNTSANFGENYIYAEAIITAALYAREKYKGTGTPDFYCTPHLLNVMLLARDMNGRRIYDSKADLAKALNVGEIETAEQFENKIRKDQDQKEHKLLGIFVNLSDYQFGATKGGEIAKFNQFDIDFNQEKYLIETRLSGALTRVYSAIALEEPVGE